MPQSIECEASINVVLDGIDSDQAYSLVNRFLSAVAWREDASAVNEGGWVSNHRETSVPRSRGLLAHNWAGVYPKCSPQDAIQKRALSLYREARVAEQSDLPTFAVLGFYRILEMKGKGSQEDARQWIEQNENTICGIHGIHDVIERVRRERGHLSLSRYLLGKCRVAVAHATGSTSTFDPDNYSEVCRMINAARVLRYCARHFLTSELRLTE